MPGTNENTPTTHESADRREFFRIDDHIGLEISWLKSDQDTYADPFIDSPLESLKAEFLRLDQDVKSHLVTLAERDRSLAALVKSLNGKLDTLARIIAFEQNPLQPEDWQDVTLSEGGVAFSSSPDTWKKGDRMAVRMTLPPELYQPQAMAEVYDIQPEEHGNTRIHAAFVQIDDSDRQQIARHVMQWQIRQRQKE